jgi:hypothetical protein
MMRYEIVVRGTLSPSLLSTFSDVQLEDRDEETLLVIDVIDQAQMHGLIDWLYECSTEIVSLKLMRRGASESA